MAFKTTEWKFSNEVDQTQIPINEGQAYMFIRDARYDEEKGIYTLEMEDLTTTAQFALRYYLEQRDEYNQVSVNAQAKGTLISLGIALAGAPIGVPNPSDVIGGVVSGVINLKTTAKGTTYPRVYHFDPVPEDIANCGTIEQYFIGQDVASEEDAEEQPVE